jgi:myo-inositol-1(or 4)-monophosphatase
MHGVAGKPMNEYMVTARKAAVLAGQLLRDNLGGKRTIAFKGDINLVTEMDTRAERVVVETLLHAFPDHGILSEEEATIEKESPFRWIIDPLDGTTNYAHGYPCFAVSLALESAGEVIAGVVYDPMREELFSAAKGQGAHLNGQRIKVSTTESLIQSLLATGFPYDRCTSEKNNLNYFNELLLASQEVRRDGSAALDLCSVAAGRFDGFWELKLKPWDVAAGSLIVREAGGTVSDFRGMRSSIHDQEIVASNGMIHSKMLTILQK